MRLPQEEVAHALLSGRADDEVRVRELRVIQPRGDRRFVDLPRLEAFRD